MPLDEFDAAQRQLSEQCGGDKSANDISRVLRLPGFFHQKVSQKKGLTGQPHLVRATIHADRPALSWWLLKGSFATKVQISDPNSYTLQIDQARVIPLLREALYYLDLGNRDDWIAVGAGLKELGEEGFILWHEASRRSENYVDEADCRKTWNDLGHSRTNYRNVFVRAVKNDWDPSAWKQLVAEAAFSRPQNFQVPTHLAAFRLIHISELLANISEPDWLIEGFIEANSLSLLFGDPETGKSLLAMWFSVCVAAGQKWCEKAVKKGGVVYLCGEGHSGIGRRLGALKEAYNITDIENSPLYASSFAIDLLNEGRVIELIQTIETVINNEGVPKLLVVDTLHCHLGGGDENSAADIGKLIGALNVIRAKYGCACLIVHHSGHESKSRARGSSSLKAAVDTELQLKKTSNEVVLICTKSKDFEPPEKLSFELLPITYTVPSLANKPITSVVLRKKDNPLCLEALSEKEEVVLSALKEAIKHVNEQPVTKHAWRDLAVTRNISKDNPGTRRKAFDRLSNALINKGCVMIEDDRCRLSDKWTNVVLSGHCPNAENGGDGQTWTPP
jgi:hypothetical protein